MMRARVANTAIGTCHGAVFPTHEKAVLDKRLPDVGGHDRTQRIYGRLVDTVKRCRIRQRPLAQTVTETGQILLTGWANSGSDAFSLRSVLYLCLTSTAGELRERRACSRKFFVVERDCNFDELGERSHKHCRIANKKTVGTLNESLRNKDMEEVSKSRLLTTRARR